MDRSVQFSLVQSLSRVRLFMTPWTATCQASLSTTNSQSLLKLTSIESVMPSSHLILCHPLLLLPPIPPSIRVFSNESAFCMRWPKYWSFSFSISPYRLRFNSIFKSRDITLPTKVHLVKAMVFLVIMYGCESWTVKKAECWRIDAFELCLVLEKTLESPLDCKEIQPVHSKGDQS